jgi:hypothetical protein
VEQSGGGDAEGLKGLVTSFFMDGGASAKPTATPPAVEKRP